MVLARVCCRDMILVEMRNISKATAGTLLLGFLGANVFVTFCVMAAPMMPGCPMPMADSDGPAWSTSYDCCLSCVESTTLPTNVGFGAGNGLAILGPSNAGSLSAQGPTFEFGEQIPPELATVSPPVFLLNSTFLI